MAEEKAFPTPGGRALHLLEDPQVARVYEAMLARVRAGELSRTDPWWIDVRDEMEIRVEENGPFRVGSIVYIWSGLDRSIIRNSTRKRKLKRREAGDPRGAADKTVYRDPVRARRVSCQAKDDEALFGLMEVVA